MKTRYPSRARDEEVLAWVRRRANGESAYQIAEKVRVNTGVIIVATNNVKKADIAEAGEPEAKVRQGYW